VPNLFPLANISGQLTLGALGGGGVVAPTASAVTAGTQESDGDVPIYVADLNVSCTGFWVLVPDGSTAPSQAEVLAGEASGGGAPEDGGSFAANPLGGSVDVDISAAIIGVFDLYVVFQNAAGASPVYSDTAISIKTTLPVVSITGVTAGSTQLSIDWETDTGDGTARIVAVPNGATAPTATEILAGEASGGGAPSSDSGNVTVSGTGAQTTVVLTGLTNGVAYDIHLAHGDQFSNVDTDSDLNNSPVGVSAVVFNPSHTTLVSNGGSFTARTGSNRLIVANIGWRSNDADADNPLTSEFTVTIGGVAMTTQAVEGRRFNAGAAQFTMLDADIPAGSNVVSFTTSTGLSMTAEYIELVEMTAVDQATPVRGITGDSDISGPTAFSIAGTSTEDNSLILTAAGISGTGYTDTVTGATVLTDDETGGLMRFTSTYEEKASAGAWSHNHANESGRAWAYTGPEVLPA
jgi:hypothetical protein